MVGSIQDVEDTSSLSHSNVFEFNALGQGCAMFCNGGPNTNKHNILRAAPLNRIIFLLIKILNIT